MNNINNSTALTYLPLTQSDVAFLEKIFDKGSSMPVLDEEHFQEVLKSSKDSLPAELLESITEAAGKDFESALREGFEAARKEKLDRRGKCIMLRAKLLEAASRKSEFSGVDLDQN